MIDLSKVLEYSPYDNKCPSPFGFRISQEKEEDLFYDKMFVEYPHESSKLENKLVSAIEDENIHTIVFSGASGSGKTTFLKNFFRNREDSFSCQFFNFIEKPSVIDSDNCFRTSVLNAIGGVLSKNVASIFINLILSSGAI